MPFMTGPEGQKRLEKWRADAERAAQQAAMRRAQVLRHDWARKRLCEIFGYRRADQWTVYLPPRFNPQADNGSVTFNSADARVALIALLDEINQYDEEHDKEHGGPAEDAI